MRSLLLDVGTGNDLGGQVKPFAQVVETLWGQSVVKVLPRELSLDITTGAERLARLDDIEVLGIDVRVLGKVVVLLGNENALTKEVLMSVLAVISHLGRDSGRMNIYLVDLFAVGLRNEHRCG